jgi:ribosomal protein L27
MGQNTSDARGKRNMPRNNSKKQNGQIIFDRKTFLQQNGTTATNGSSVGYGM